MHERVMVPCGGCARHVRVGEGPCPFCGAVVEGAGASVYDADPGAPRGLSRGRAALVLAATVAASLSLAACYGGPPRPQAYGQDGPRPSSPSQADPDGGPPAQVAQ